MSIEEIIKIIEDDIKCLEHECCFDCENCDYDTEDYPTAAREAIAKLRDYQVLQSGDTSARMAAIKDISTEQLIELAQAEAAGMVRIVDPVATLCDDQKAQPNEPQGDGWISVEDRLPEPCLDVLIYDENGEMGIDAMGSCGEWMSWSVVTHWRPLPEPPEEERG